LEKRVNKRTCSLSKLKKMPFLKDFEWEDFEDFKIVPPYIPKCEDYLGKLNFFTDSYEKLNSKNVKKIKNFFYFFFF